MKRALGVATSLLTIVALTGCGPGAADLPLPGTTVPGDSSEMSAEFVDALNLSVGAKVKVNGVDVGRVKSVTTKDFHAIATLRVTEDSGIRRGATARLRYNTPLGELFVDVRSPNTGPVLGPGAKMLPRNTTTAPTVEDTLASVSLLVNGGGLGQIKTITNEVNTAVSGRGPTVRALLERTSDFFNEANATSAQFDRALRALAGAAGVLKERKGVINRALNEITPASRVVRKNTADMVALLKQLVRLTRKADGLVGASGDDLLVTLPELGKVLDSFYALRGEFGGGLEQLSTAAKFLDRTIPGDWAPLWLNLIVSDSLISLPGGDGQIPVPGLPELPTIPLPTIPGLPPLGLPQLPGLPILPDLGLGLRASPRSSGNDAPGGARR